MSRKPITIKMRDQEQVILRADLSDAKTQAALKAVGLSAPEPRQRVEKGDNSVMWFSPDEALMFVSNAEATIKKMAAKLPDRHLIHDATGARVVFTLKGKYLRDVLAKGTPRDVMSVEIGEVVRTHLGQFAVAFWFLDEKTVELVAFRSLSEGLQLWLETESLPDGLPVMAT